MRLQKILIKMKFLVYYMFVKLLITHFELKSLKFFLSDLIKYKLFILNILTDRHQQKVYTQIRLLLEKQADQGLHYLPFQHCLINISSYYKINIMSIKLTLNAQISTKVVCSSRLLKCLRCLYGKQCGPVLSPRCLLLYLICQ